jgi:hypothetical protein
MSSNESTISLNHQVADEPMLSVHAAVEQVSGQRPSPATCARWTTGRGVKGERLASWMCGGRRKTTPSAVRDFFERTTRAASGDHRESPLPRTARRRNTAIDAAEKELRDSGA